MRCLRGSLENPASAGETPWFPIWCGMHGFPLVIEGVGRAFALLLLAMSAAAPAALSGQQEASPPIRETDLIRYATAHAAMGEARDAFQGLLARTHEPQEQERLRAELAETLEQILVDHEMEREEYERVTAAISADEDLRSRFERITRDLAGAVRDTIAFKSQNAFRNMMAS